MLLLSVSNVELRSAALCETLGHPGLGNAPLSMYRGASGTCLSRRAQRGRQYRCSLLVLQSNTAQIKRGAYAGPVRGACEQACSSGSLASAGSIQSFHAPATVTICHAPLRVSQVREHLMVRQAGGSFAGVRPASLCSVVTNCNGRHADVINVSSLNLAKTIVYHPSLSTPP